MLTQEQTKELSEMKEVFLALRKIADQGLGMVERMELKYASPRRRPVKRVKYKTLILSGTRATKKNLNLLTH